MTRVEFQVDYHLQKSCHLQKSRDLMDLGEDQPGCRQMEFVFQGNKQFSKRMKRRTSSELKSAIDKIILVTQADGGQETMQTAKQTRLNVG